MVLEFFMLLSFFYLLTAATATLLLPCPEGHYFGNGSCQFCPNVCARSLSQLTDDEIRICRFDDSVKLSCFRYTTGAPSPTSNSTSASKFLNSTDVNATSSPEACGTSYSLVVVVTVVVTALVMLAIFLVLLQHPSFYTYMYEMKMRKRRKREKQAKPDKEDKPGDIEGQEYASSKMVTVNEAIYPPIPPGVPKKPQSDDSDSFHSMDNSEQFKPAPDFPRYYQDPNTGVVVDLSDGCDNTELQVHV